MFQCKVTCKCICIVTGEIWHASLNHDKMAVWNTKIKKNLKILK